MNGTEADFIFKAREMVMERPVTFAEYMVDDGIEAEQHSWNHIWREFLKYAQKGDRGGLARENARMDGQKDEMRSREPHPTLYPGE
eukprot:2492776-Pleurochrysis_carterae.AAC.1